MNTSVFLKTCTNKHRVWSLIQMDDANDLYYNFGNQFNFIFELKFNILIFLRSDTAWSLYQSGQRK